MTQLQSTGYTSRHLKGDIGVGLCSGATFGLVYSFFYWHVEKGQFKLLGKSRSSLPLYVLSNAVKMGVGWSLMRTTWNWTKKQELNSYKKWGSMFTAFGLTCCIM